MVYEGLARTTTCRCPPENTVFVTGEPPSVRQYNPLFLRQFSTVVSCHRNIIHRNVIHAQPALPWMIGMSFDGRSKSWRTGCSKDYDELCSMSNVPKDRGVSVITSDKTVTRGHRKRLDFVRRLERDLNGELDVFITSNNSMEDKWDAIGRYRYHIALENSVNPDYWTEKLSDAVLGLSYPIYCGCPNLSDYFPAGSYRRIDMDDYDRSLRTIREVIGSDLRERNIEALKEAKRLVLDRYNIFPALADMLIKMPFGSEKTEVSLRPEKMIYTRDLKSLCRGVGGVIKGAITEVVDQN